ncbi:DNA polymerase epsilon subunit B [Sistotremastrum niveocremeum HHB9708]|uniref:DNA polymerase epsilon subunit n=2 Tax=Sistotremastraceae TaxID=3402574 RepID=A0A164ZTF8_9AGAM|nr:DNA polymerase epsilon subunit B [Sistotremastrum niveocremeum HHB9708]KZT38344.1 epsilon DNA polymerase [Sistotremastrum suecicum HHB10207 ss-3]
MSTQRQRAIIKGFRQQNFSLGPDALSLLESICDQHEIDDENIEASVQYFVDGYAKQDDATMKVSMAILQRVYDDFQTSQEGSANDGESSLDPDTHLHFIDAFDMPAWHWSPEKSGFEKISKRPTISGTADSRISAIRNRLHVIRQTILRSEHFTVSTIPSRDGAKLLELRSTKDLLGRADQDFLLFGMLFHSNAGTLCLEDLDGKVELDMSVLDELGGPGEGFFTEGCFALVEGTYTDEETFIVKVLGHPPCERRDAARSVHGHIDFIGKGSTTISEDLNYTRSLRIEHSSLSFFVFSDVWLDDERTFDGLRRVFESCIANAFVPKVFVFCGNFSSKGVVRSNGKSIMKYQESFDRLADLLASFELITRTSRFLFVPGPLDLIESPSSILPRRPLMPAFTSRLRSKLPHVVIGSNPCRIMFCGQEVVIFRDDLIARMIRSSILKPTHGNEADLKKFLVQTIIDQCHLSPLALQVQPTLWELDHSLRLYPMPTALVLADKYEQYELTYEGCHVFNPGSFLGNVFGFSTYFPATARSQFSELGMEED